MTTDLRQKLMLMQYLLRKLHERGRMEGGPLSDTSGGQGRILALLKMRDGVTMKDLSYLLGLAPSSMSEMLTKLEKNGYIVREEDKEDKRVTIIRLTEKGKRVEQEAGPEIGDIFAVLSEEECANLGLYLDKIIAGLKDRLGFTDEEAEMRMNFANEKMQEIMEHFHGRHGRTHHDFEKHRDWHERHGFFGRGNKNKEGR